VFVGMPRTVTEFAAVRRALTGDRRVFSGSGDRTDVPVELPWKRHSLVNPLMRLRCNPGGDAPYASS
jgi:hypothetical protein